MFHRFTQEDEEDSGSDKVSLGSDPLPSEYARFSCSMMEANLDPIVIDLYDYRPIDC